MVASVSQIHMLIVRIGLLIVFLAATANPLLAEAVDIRILFASNIQEISTQKEDKGLARLASALDYERSQTGSTVFLFGGDSLGPSLLGSFDKGSHIIDLLNALKPDSMALGGHELVYGWDALAQRIKEAGTFPDPFGEPDRSENGQSNPRNNALQNHQIGTTDTRFDQCHFRGSIDKFPGARSADRR